jgi:hypothetical protein
MDEEEEELAGGGLPRVTRLDAGEIVGRLPRTRLTLNGPGDDDDGGGREMMHCLLKLHGANRDGRQAGCLWEGGENDEGLLDLSGVEWMSE